MLIAVYRNIVRGSFSLQQQHLPPRSASNIVCDAMVCGKVKKKRGFVCVALNSFGLD